MAPHTPLAEGLLGTRRWWLLGDGSAHELRVSAVRRQGAALVAKWEGCDSPEAADALKGAGIAVARGDFPQLAANEYYWVDLIGLQVIDRRGRKLGSVKGLRACAAHDLLEIEPVSPGSEILVPMVGEFVDGVDVVAGEIHVNWEPEWLA